MMITPKMVETLLSRHGIRPPDSTVARLAADLAAAFRVSGAVAKVKAEESAMLDRHQAERGEMMERLGRACKECPHPARSSSLDGHPRPRLTWTCDVCGQWLLDD